MVRDAPGGMEIVTLAEIAKYFGISLTSFKTKHLEAMKAGGIVWWRICGRPRHLEYFAKEEDLSDYGKSLARAGKGL